MLIGNSRIAADEREVAAAGRRMWVAPAVAKLPGRGAEGNGSVSGPDSVGKHS